MLASRRQANLQLLFRPPSVHNFDYQSDHTPSPQPNQLASFTHTPLTPSSPNYLAPAFSLTPGTTSGATFDDYLSSALDFSNPAIRVQQSTPTPQLPFYPQQSVLVDGSQMGSGWLYGEDGAQRLGGSALQASALNKRNNKTHQRVTSSSSAGSSSNPASPFTQSRLINQPNQLPTPTQTPTSQETFLASTQPNMNNQFQNFDSTMAAHLAIKNAFADGNSMNEEDAPGFSHSTRHSVSSYGRNSPATPRTVNGEDFEEGLKVPSNDTSTRSSSQMPKLERTITDIFSDELFNPMMASQPQSVQKPTKNLSLLAPYHNNMITERLQQANQARSQSPAASNTRAISPFRQDSPHAPPSNKFDPPQPRFATAQHARERQAAASLTNALSRQNMMSRKDSEPKTISPRDALLEFHETDGDAKLSSLFPENDNNNNFTPFSAPQSTNASFANLAVSNVANVDAWSSAVGQGSSAYGTASTLPQSQFTFAPTSVPGAFHSNLSSNAFPTSNNMPSVSDDTPEFPASLNSMESSMSEAPPQSSAESNPAELISKPSSTLADSGTYTCTYHGCVQRFETPQKLQRHKREAHRQSVQTQVQSQQQQQAPQQAQAEHTPGVGSGMTSAALLARNSQAGPHKCDRINPTTGKPCNTIFSRPYDLTRHEDTIHNARKQKVRCALCQEDKTFSRNDALTRHMRVVHPDVDFPGKHRRRGGRGDD